MFINIKRLLIITVIVLFSTFPAYGGQDLLVAVDSTGAGNSKKVRYIPDVHVVECHYTDANTSITALTVDFEGSINKTNWYQLSQHEFSGGEITAKQAVFFTINAPVEYVRANITTLTGVDVGTDEITCLYDFHKEEN